MKRTTDFLKMKENSEKITMITAYDCPSAQLAEQSGIDMILVGDSLGMVVLGYESTVFVTLDDMIHHTKAVKRGVKQTFIVTDMPFMTYHLSEDETLKAAAKLMQEGGADAVKIEGGSEKIISQIKALTTAGIPVVAHLGLTPQSVGVLGGYKVQGKSIEEAELLMKEAKLCEEAGAFAIVLECIPKQLASQVSKILTIPTIGIGAGVETDGQVLVFHDLISYGVERVPSFVKQYGDCNEVIGNSIQQYIVEVKEKTFPSDNHSFTMNKEDLTALYGGQ